MEKPEEGRQTVSGVLSDPRRRILAILAAALLGVAAIGLVMLFALNVVEDLDEVQTLLTGAMPGGESV